MKNMKKLIVSLMLAALLVTAMSTSVFAAESGNAWLDVAVSDDGNTIVSIVADDAVMDGLVELTFDGATLQYAGLEINSDAVAVHSVNTTEAGTVKLAWVAPGEYEAGEGTAVITITFTGTAQQIPVMSGKLNDTQGDALQILSYVEADKSALKKAVLAAQGLDAVHYSEESFAVLQEALAVAQNVLNEEFALQADVDTAAENLLNAISGLVLVQTGASGELDYTELTKAILIAKSLNRFDYTEESFAAMEAALAKAEAEFTTQEDIDAAAAELNAAIYALVLNTNVPDTGRDFMTAPLIALVVLSAVGVVATIVLLNQKKGRCAK